tara:strand:- start:178 stop:309 length:132 start_codon:yes stop_codon:yes gene_type:complete
MKPTKTLTLQQWQTNEKGWYVMDGERCVGIVWENEITFNEEVE